MRTQLPAITAAVVLLALTGCGEDEPDRYDTPQAVVAALEEQGVSCAGYDETQGAVGAVARGSCRMGGEVIVSVYATEADAEGEPQRKSQLLGGLAVTMVVGENWTASCDVLADCEKIADTTGANLVRLPA